MIEAAVNMGGEAGGIGTFEFRELPRSGDRIVVANNRGSLDILVVDYVEHSPVALPRRPYAKPTADLTVFATYHSSYGD